MRKKPTPTTSRQAIYAFKKAALLREIGNIPKVKNKTRRDSCRLNFRLFLETYCVMPGQLPYSQMHYDEIAMVESCILKGALHAMAMPRGVGKSTILEFGAAWATLYAHRKYILYICATGKLAQESWKRIKSIFETNQLVMDDFPEICHAVAHIGGIANKCPGQLCRGKRTHIAWGVKLVFPSLKESIAAGNDGCVIDCTGVTGNMKGRAHTTPSGAKIRPSMCILDDLQKREAAISADSTAKLLEVIHGDVLGLTGSDQDMAGIFLANIVAPGDAASQLTDRKLYPQWRGVRKSMILKMPDEIDGLWRKYIDIKKNNYSETGDAATDFYKANQVAMDNGAECSWPDLRKGRLTALQFAIDKFVEVGSDAFYNQYQNDPTSTIAALYNLTNEDVQNKANGLPRMTVPLETAYLIAFIDCQLIGLNWVVLGVQTNFTAQVCDYGIFPGDKLIWEKSITSESSNQALAKYITQLLDALEQKVYIKNGKQIKLDIIGIDRGKFAKIVIGAIKGKHRSIKVIPNYGKANFQFKIPPTCRRKGDGIYEKFDDDLPTTSQNSDYWKEQTQKAFLLQHGVPGGLSLYGKPEDHQLYGQHIIAETLMRKEGDHYKWKTHVGFPNHFLDATTGAMAQASLLGCSLSGVPEIKKKVKVSFVQNKSSNSGGFANGWRR